MKRNNKLYYFKIYKPYGVLSQFTDSEGRETLSNLYRFPEEVYPVGRLDRDSEGLLLLTNDKKLTDLLLNPKYGHRREYSVQVEGIPTEADLSRLREGVIIDKIKTKPAEVSFLGDEIKFHDRTPPIRFRKNIPDTWIKLILTEGRNRQVRKMTAAIGFPTLRLIRTRIENIKLDNMKIGEVLNLSKDELSTLLVILNKSIKFF
ncbi:MAG: pseudouridine synthase [Ignavibacteriaceae bacterium]|nr:pseudouridine synthase [Ignavibacteriaceae bacterium]